MNIKINLDLYLINLSFPVELFYDVGNKSLWLYPLTRFLPMRAQLKRLLLKPRVFDVCEEEKQFFCTKCSFFRNYTLYSKFLTTSKRLNFLLCCCVTFCLNQGWPNFLDCGPFSEIWTKARTTPHNSIFPFFHFPLISGFIFRD